MRKVHWLQLTTGDFANLDPEKTIAVLPIAAIEQHGPHLAVSTDTVIGQGMIDAVIARLPADLSALFLPVQAVGKSNEHIRSPGTITYTAETAQRVWTEIGESVARAGIRKLVIVTSHGGNVDTMRVVARELRVNCQMLVVTTGWRFGVPKGLFSDQEALHGIHAGDLDMLEVYREATRILHFDHSERPWLKMIGATPGEVMGLPNGRMAVGAPAGVVLTRARTMNELLSRPQTDRVVLCAGKQIDRTLPDYRELD